MKTSVLITWVFCAGLWAGVATNSFAQADGWTRRCSPDKGSTDRAAKVITDAQDNVIVVGSTDDNLTGANALIIKYSSAGVPLWTNRHGGWGYGTDLAADASGNVFMTGYSSAREGYVTVAYSSAGASLWTNQFASGFYAQAAAVAVSSSGQVFVTGNSYSNGHYEIVTIGYSNAGLPLWTNVCNGPFDRGAVPKAIGVDASGNVFVTGMAARSRDYDFDFVTLAYSAAGVPLWTNSYNGPADMEDTPHALRVDSSGNVIVMGYSIRESLPGQGYGSDYTTIKYSGAGVPLWTNRHRFSYSDNATALATDSSGNAFVTGYSVGGITTIAYSAAGATLWTNRYIETNLHAIAVAVVVNPAGNVFVSGKTYHYDGNLLIDYNYVTLAYSDAGVPLWTNRCRGPNDDEEMSLAMAVDSHDRLLLLVSGSSTSLRSSADFATTAFSDDGAGVWTNYYNGPGHGYASPVDLAVDFGGNVIVTSYSYGSNPYAESMTVSYADSGVPLWTNWFSGHTDRPYHEPLAMRVGSNGTVFVTGASLGTTNWESTTYALSREGALLWSHTYGGGFAWALAVTPDGGACIVAQSGTNWVTLKYSNAGVPLWTNLYGGLHGGVNGGDFPTAMAADLNGTVFVTGSYATVAYANGGMPLWTNRYQGHSRDIAVGAQGKVFITGDYGTVAYANGGTPLWTNSFSRNGQALALDTHGNVYVTGSGWGEYEDYVTAAFSGTGTLLWESYFEGAGEDRAMDIAVDSNGNVVVTGASDNGYNYENGSSFDYGTVAYSPSGAQLWSRIYNGPTSGRDTAARVAAGPNGAVYVTGSSASGASRHGESPASSEALTIKYIPAPRLNVQLSGEAAVNLMLSGAPDTSWWVERALEITGPWTNLGLVTLNSSGSASFQDANRPGPSAFYRVRQQ